MFDNAAEKIAPPDLRKHEPREEKPPPKSPSRHRVVIVGGGFGGLHCARQLEHHQNLDIILIDRRNYHLFIPLLYQVATGALSPANIAAPLRTIFRRRPNVRVVLGEVTGVNAAEKTVSLKSGVIEYDSLVLAAGAPTHHYFGNKQWGEHAPGLKSIEDATDIRSRILMAFEAAEREPDPVRRRVLQTFVLVGAGPTGVEMAGAIAEIANQTLPGEFSNIDPAESRVYLLEGMDQVLPAWNEKLAKRTRRSLRELGVTVVTGAMVKDIQAERVDVEKDGKIRRINAGTILWAGGVQASPLGRALCDELGCELEKTGQLHVERDLTVPGHPDIFVIGDMAYLEGEDGDPLPGLAAVAMQQGQHTAEVIRARLRGEGSPPFRYNDRGIMATIGRKSAVVDFGTLKLWGWPGWLLWLFVHLLFMVLFQNRTLVLVQWAWHYLTRNRSARLITHRDVEELVTEGTKTPLRLPRDE